MNFFLSNEKMRRTCWLTFVCLTLSVLITACDPAIYYSPRGWSNVSGRMWAGRVSNLELQLSSVGGFIGEDWLTIELTLENHESKTVKLQAVALRTKRGTFLARPTPEENNWQPIASGANAKLPIWFDTKRPNYEVLQDPVVLILKFQIGEEAAEFEIPFDQSFPRKN